MTGADIGFVRRFLWDRLSFFVEPSSEDAPSAKTISHDLDDGRNGKSRLLTER
jgi:hypothetical protein